MDGYIEKTIGNRFNEKEKPEWFCESSDLSLEDQKWIWHNIQYETKNQANDNVNVSGNDTCKHFINSELKRTKQKAIADLETCTYRTSPKKIASLLEEIFVSYESKPGHWLFIAQHWPPRAINRVIAYIINVHASGRVTIKNPAAYFTFLIKRRKKRKEFTGINGISRRQE